MIRYVLTHKMDLQVTFPSLEEFKISHMENLKIIWDNQSAEDSFFKLQNLIVECCENLINIFQSNKCCENLINIFQSKIPFSSLK